MFLLAAALGVLLPFRECEMYAYPDRTSTDVAPPPPVVERFAARKIDPKAAPALDKDRRRWIIVGVMSEARGGRDIS